MINPLKRVVPFLFISMLFLSTQCDEDDIVADDFPCEFSVVVNQTEYDNLVSDNVTLVNAEISLDCLFLTISSSGCSGENWTFNLIDSGAIAESSPEQRFLKFALNNDEACLAVIDRTISFDLKPLRISNSNEIILNIEGLPDSLNYKY
ncbi:hypothetical protein GCM10023315_11650 [Algibacter aquimarinus]|uniref:Lipocalin-like domain-containing protein n=2 Tax=Algibacter aquimarinus TaxID=1136748 RepID=A0ABP9H966_9FLAO